MAAEETLSSWSFLKDYSDKNKRRELIDRAKFVYSVAKQLKGTAPSKDECKAYYGEALDGSHFYLDNFAEKKRFLKREYYRAFALLLADYVIEKNWADIQSP
jgi:hypothetical protein